MNFNKFTIKAQEALQMAQQLAMQNQHSAPMWFLWSKARVVRGTTAKNKPS